VRECDSVEHIALLVTALRHYDEGNVIVYSPTISKVEESVDFLEDQGIAAVGYHAKMDSGERRRNQERWMSDDSARGSWARLRSVWGLNKATVRAGHPSGAAQVSGAVLSGGGTRRARWKSRPTVFSFGGSRMRVCSRIFANQIVDAAERDRAWQRYRTIRAFAESGKCRHCQICTHFGETLRSGCRVEAVTFAELRREWLTETVTPASVRRTVVGHGFHRRASGADSRRSG